MREQFFEGEVEKALKTLQAGGVILYPTDTVWGLGCDATNEEAIKKIYSIKRRSDQKSLIILLAEEREVLQYVAAPDLAVFDYLQTVDRPTTVIFQQALGLPPALVAPDGSIAIRLVEDPFCRHLIKRLRRPLVSTSANVSGLPSPADFSEIDPSLKTAVDHVVQWRQEEKRPATPSRIIRWDNNGNFTVIRD